MENITLDKDTWNKFVLEQNGSFLQSWEWGEFQRAIGRQVFFFKNDDWQSLIIKHNLLLGKSYFYCSCGPVILSRQQAAKNLSRMRDFIDEIRKIAKKENAIFLRIEPTFETSEDELKKLGFVKTKDVQPSRTLILDLAKSEEELLSQMHEKTRYNIGLAQRKGIIIKNFQFPISNSQFETFWRLVYKTSARQKIHLHPKEYYRKQLMLNNEQLQMKLFMAEYGQKTIAANIVVFFNRTATYLHGGSDNEYRALMAPHLLQWEQIKEAKNRGCQFYDFWGIDEQKWPGITRFKRGFGGREVNHLGCWDWPVDKKWYRVYRIVQKIRK